MAIINPRCQCRCHLSCFRRLRPRLHPRLRPRLPRPLRFLPRLPLRLQFGRVCFKMNVLNLFAQCSMVRLGKIQMGQWNVAFQTQVRGRPPHLRTRSLWTVFSTAASQVSLLWSIFVTHSLTLSLTQKQLHAAIMSDKIIVEIIHI